MSSPTFAEVQRISDVYSSGIWASPFQGEPIFKNATSSSIYAYVTICNEGGTVPPTQSVDVQLMNGPVAVGMISPGTCMGFLLSIVAGQSLTLTQDVPVGFYSSSDTLTIAHVSLGAANPYYEKEKLHNIGWNQGRR